MAIRVKLDTKGFDEYVEALIRAGKAVDETAQEALQAGAEVLLAGMQRRAPRDTGNLAEHLSISGPHQDLVEGHHWAYIGLNRGIERRLAIYATAQEYGTVKMPPHPFIRPAIAEDGKRARAAMRAVFKERMGME